MYCCVVWGTTGGMHQQDPNSVDVHGIQSLITDDLPKNWVGYGVKILFSFNLFFSYPLVLYPAHIVIENILYDGWPKNKKRQMSKNATRTILVAFTVILTLLIGKKLDKFLGIVGSLTCTPIAFTFPALFHLYACAETTK